MLKDQLRRRQALRPRYSLRAFARWLEISPSKLSEIISGKKRLGVPRAEKMAEKLMLTKKEREIFVLSVRLDSSVAKIEKKQIKSLLQELSAQVPVPKTRQRNAWYFGAVKALEDEGIDASLWGKSLHISDLQVENAKRFRQRIKKFHPDRQDYTFEPVSVLKKVEDSLCVGVPGLLEAEFVFLTGEQVEALKQKIREVIRSAQDRDHPVQPEDLQMFHWGTMALIQR